MNNLVNLDYATAERRILAQPEFSLLRGHSLVELPVALARRMARTKVTDPSMALLNRLFMSLSWKAQQQCKAELTRCRQAIRNPTPARVAP